MTRLFSVLFLLLAVSCNGPGIYLRSKEDPWLRYERTPCFGPCPAFVLEVAPGGNARFHGRRHMSLEGVHEAHWDADVLHGIAEAAHAVSFRRHAGTYDNPLITDLPAKKLALGGSDLFDRVDGPPIGALYDHLDSLIAVTDWTAAGH